MKKIAILALAVGLLAFSGPTASAQPEAGDAGIFADPEGTRPTLPNIVDFAPFSWYVVGFDLVGEPKAHEFSLDVPPGLTITAVTLAGPGPGNLGDNTNVIAFTGACIDGSGALVLASYTGGFFAPGLVVDDMTFCMGASTPSSFEPPAPGYSQCDSILVPFGVAQNGMPQYPNGCMVINPSGEVVSTEVESFGGIKARF